MTTARKSFLFSLMFHTLMGSLAFFVLVQMRTPPPMVKIPLQHMILVSLSHSEPVVKQPTISEPIPVVTPQQPTQKPTVTQPIIPMKPVVSTVQTVATPIPLISTPPAVQHTLQTIAAPSKPKVDITAEKQSFLASLRSKIQQNLHYPFTARRVGKEGNVNVRFVMESTGMIRDITVQQGESIFHNAAKAAVASASGANVPKSLTDALPMEMELSLEFKLNN
ncbi:MAG: energy transducer TonB [Sulfuricurvum sp.]|uniref:energy transducer TonB n=1 Tax=Sulfuricurvum sp. TaxID=2025608 RepID=UPI0025F3CB6D|nr:energy transducer TonB [Sulfuricurvum sp.]MBV5321215.1 energy transducer TonB [Sulfuricurvum sp.]